VNEKESKAQLNSAREKLNEIRAARIEQETRVREASNLFLKVIWCYMYGVSVSVILLSSSRCFCVQVTSLRRVLTT